MEHRNQVCGKHLPRGSSSFTARWEALAYRFVKRTKENSPLKYSGRSTSPLSLSSIFPACSSTPYAEVSSDFRQTLSRLVQKSLAGVRSVL